MRLLSSEALTKLANKTGNEPIVIVEIAWNSGTVVKYADKELPGIKAAITELSNLDEVIKLDIGSSTASISMTLDDTDGTVKALMDEFDIHKAPVTVKQYFTGLALSDAFEIFRGEIYSPIVWDEGARTVSFDVVSKIYEIEAGFAPEEGQFANIPLELTGNPWPLGFGSPEHVPAVKNSQVTSATAISIGGVPDATLPLKQEILTWRIDQAQVAFNQYQEFITLAREIELPSAQLQEEYTQFIIGKDQLRQTIEDLTIELDNINDQIEKLIEMYGDASDATPRATIKDDLLSMRGNRDDRIEVLRNLGEQLAIFEKLEDIYGDRIDNAKFVVNFTNRLRQKCRKLLNDIYHFQRELTIVNQAINDQTVRATATVAVNGGNKFAQNVNVTTLANGVTLSGIFSNGRYTIGAPQPSYTGITPATRQSDELDAFWLSDSGLNLTNMYIKFQGKYVTKVLRQEGNKCIIQLPKKLNNSRLRKRYIDYEDDTLTKDVFDAALTRLLTGVETPEQVAQIAATIPRDINPATMNKLKGNGDFFYIEVLKSSSANDVEYHTNFATSLFSLKYGEYDHTETMGFLVADAPDLVDRLLSSTTLIPADSIAVEVIDQIDQSGEQYWTKLKVTHTGFLPNEFKLSSWKLDCTDFERPDYLMLYYPNVQGQEVKINVNYASLKPSHRDDIIFTTPDALFQDGTIDIYVCGKKKTYQVDGSLTGSNIVTSLIAAGIIQSGEMTGTGDLTTDPQQREITLTYNLPMRSIYVDVQNVVIRSDDPPIDVDKPFEDNQLQNKLILGLPRLVVTYTGASAHEFTREEIRKKIENAGKNSPASAGLKKFRDKIDELMKLRKEQQKDGRIDSGVEAALNKLTGMMTEIAKKSKAPETTIEEIHKIISDEEYKRLYDLEVNSYLEFVSEARPIDVTFDEKESYEFTAEDITFIEEVAPIILPSWMAPIAGIENQYERIRYIEALPRSTQAFYINVGDQIHLAEAFQEQYVANIIQSEVHAVYAERNILGLRRLVPVPSSYYTIVDEDYGGYTCTVLKLARPLKWFDPSWEEKIYVTYTSLEGPNVCGIIRWLVAKYTTIEVDNTSFNHVEDLLSNYPANFALLDKRDCLSLIEDIAWQSRCQVWVSRGKMYIRYLSETPTSYKTITQSDIIEKSLKLTFTNTEELITKFTGTWRPNHYNKDPFKLVVRRNVSKYKEVLDEHNFFIYNNQDLVYKSLTFWSIRRGNSWRRVMFKLFLNHLDLETQDIITLNLSQNHIVDEATKGVIESANYNSDGKTIDITVWLPVLANEKLEYQWAWPKDLTVDVIYPPPEDIVQGYSGNPINIDVPSGVDYDPYDSTLFDQRPKDIGHPNMGDTNDDLPPNPAAELTQIDYNLNEAADTTLTEDSDEDGDGELDIDFAVNHGKSGKDTTSVNAGIFTALIVEVYNEEDEVQGEDVDDGVNYITTPIRRVQAILPNGNQIVAYPLHNFLTQNTINALVGSRVVVFYDRFKECYFFYTNSILPTYLSTDIE